MANSLAAIEAGARQVECTINGIGERAGNAALEEIAAALNVRATSTVSRPASRLEQLYPTSQVLGEIISFRRSRTRRLWARTPSRTKPGIHQHGMLANPLCYEIMTPASVGVPQRIWCWASIPAARAAATSESSAITLDRGRAGSVYYRFVTLADRKKNIYDQDLIVTGAAATRARRHCPCRKLIFLLTEASWYRDA